MTISTIRALLLTTLALASLTLITLAGCVDSQPQQFSAAPGTSEAHLTLDPTGTPVLSYLEQANGQIALKFVTRSNGSWSHPTTIVEAPDLLANWADFPSLHTFSDDLWVAHWLVRRPGPGFNYDAWFAHSKDRGQSFSTPVRLHTDEKPAEHGFVSLFAIPKTQTDSVQNADFGAVWLDGREVATTGTALRYATYRFDSSATTDVPEASDRGLVSSPVCDCCQTDAVTSTGNVVVAYRDRSASNIRDIAIARLHRQQWSEGVIPSADQWKISGCPVNGPALAVVHPDQPHVALAWYTEAPTPRVQVAFSADSGATFGPAIVVSQDAPIGRLDLVMLDATQVVVSWLQGGTGDLLAQRVKSDHGPDQLAEPVTILQTSTSRRAGFPQMVLDGEQLLFAYTQTRGDSTRVQTLTHDLP